MSEVFSIPASKLRPVSGRTPQQIWAQFNSLPLRATLELDTHDQRSTISVLRDGTPMFLIRKGEVDDLFTAMAEDDQLDAVVGPGSSVIAWRRGTRPPPASEISKASTQTQTTTKGTTMTISTLITKAVDNNKAAAASAAYLEAGRIANNKLTGLASKHLPLMMRGYADTALGRLLIANAAMVAAAQLRPQDQTLAKLAGAMTTSAYQEVIRSIDIEGMIDSLMNSPEIQAAINKMPKDVGDGAAA